MPKTAAPHISPPPTASHDEERRAYRQFWLLIGAGWVFTNLGYYTADLPMRFLLKDQLGADQAAVASFLFYGQFTNYIKPLAGVLSDSFPIFGTRRRHYLLISLAACGLMWLVFGLVPRRYGVLLGTYAFLHIFIVLISTVLGGVMAEGGRRFHATGRLSAQRVGIFRLCVMLGSGLGGYMAGLDFFVSAAFVAILHFALIGVFYQNVPEEPFDATGESAWVEVKRQAGELARSKTLWWAAAMIFLVIVAPGFETPLLFYQTDKLGYSKQLVGIVMLVGGGCGVLGAWLFSRVCPQVRLRPLLAVGIVIHVVAALLYLRLNTPLSAFVITGLYQGAQTFALLPLYDLAVRATPRGSEALGYSVMMSVFNLTTRLSDYLGSVVSTRGGFSFEQLILLNAATTALVLVFVPLLPRALTDRRDGERSEPALAAE